MRKTIIMLGCCLLSISMAAQQIDRRTVVSRNNPHITTMDTLSSLTVGNGHFAMTVDATGLQTFPEYYRNGVPLGTMSDWGWHSFPNPEQYRPEDALEVIDFGRGHEELYSNQFRQLGRQHDASEWLRVNPHRLHLGAIGFDLPSDYHNKITDIDQRLDLWNGTIDTWFHYREHSYHVTTLCSPTHDEVAARIESRRQLDIVLRFPYPTGGHSDDGCDWTSTKTETRTELTAVRPYGATVRRTIDGTTYTVIVSWQGKGQISQRDANTIVLHPKSRDFAFSCFFCPTERDCDRAKLSFSDMKQETANYWHDYWTRGGIVDFSHCTDPRARELERRVVLSQYLMATQEQSDTPPQETGLTYNSWFGKFHLEMEWWHQAHFALWGRPEILDHTLEWYFQAAPKAREIARRQGFKGLRWMKMTDPSGEEAPSKVGSFLIWQQPHLIYLAELLRRAGVKGTEEKYGRLVEETALFMQDFAVLDSAANRYILNGCIPAQETLKAHEVVNPPFELNYWHWALQVAREWRRKSHHDTPCEEERMTDDVINRLSPLAFNEDSLYLAAETATDTYRDRRFTSDHPALLGALGILPDSRLIDKRVMARTLDWIWDNWNWDKTWGWDYPMVAMTAARLGQTERAVDALLMPKRTNTYLPNGHNYQDSRLRVYMPGNGGLLIAVAMMCAGWDGATGRNPGFPKDWDVRWEGLLPMP